MPLVEVCLCFYPLVKPWTGNRFICFTMPEALNKNHKSEVTWCDGKSKAIDVRKLEVKVLFSSFYLSEILVSLSLSYLIHIVGLTQFIKTTNKLVFI